MTNTLELKSIFCRRRKDPGIYTSNINGKVIRLMDRQVYECIDPIEAQSLLDDPEVELLCSNENEQKAENERHKIKGKK